MSLDGVEAVVFDVLGTLVDETSGLHAAVTQARPEAAGSEVDRLVATWRSHVETRQRQIVEGAAAYVGSDALDAEAAALVARWGDPIDADALSRLGTASQRLPAWSDSVAATAALSEALPVMALSSASNRTLLRLHAHTGLRWHLAISGDAVETVKPDPALYRRAVEFAGCRAQDVLMVAAHAWDLRAARAVGMRTAYVSRPVTDPPTSADAFDAEFADLEELVAALTLLP